MFKPQIIESRLNGDINILFDKIGEENFNALNNLINKYFDEFEGISSIKIMENDDMRKKQYDYENKASSIIQQMCDYKKTSSK
jgi:hypothetical protein